MRSSILWIAVIAVGCAESLSEDGADEKSNAPLAEDSGTFDDASGGDDVGGAEGDDGDGGSGDDDGCGSTGSGDDGASGGSGGSGDSGDSGDSGAGGSDGSGAETTVVPAKSPAGAARRRRLVAFCFCPRARRLWCGRLPGRWVHR